MQSNFNEILRRVGQDMENTAGYYLAQHAQLVERAQKAVDSNTTLAGAAKLKSKQGKSGRQSDEVKKAIGQLAALKEKQKAWEESFKGFQDLLKKVAR